jgi:hypothetical protein
MTDMMVYKIIMYNIDKDGNEKYYTTNDEYDHSLICDMIDDDDVHEVKEDSI